MSSDGTHVWVTNVSEGTVSEIEASSGTVIRTIPVGTSPGACPRMEPTSGSRTNEERSVRSKRRAAPSSARSTSARPPGRVLGWNPRLGREPDGTVSEIEASSGTVIRTIHVGSNPRRVLGWNPRLGREHREDTVSEIEASSGTVIRTIHVGKVPGGVSSDGTHVWVANAEGTVSEIEASSGTVIRTIHVGSSPDGVSSDGTHVWVANAGEGTVSEIPTSYTAAKLPLPKLAATGNLTPVSGSVLVKLPGSSTFVSLAAVRQIPFGTVIDATHGRVRVTTAGPHGGTQTGEFFEGEFVLTQGRDGLVVATLTGGDFSGCPTARERSHTGTRELSHASGKHVVRKLWTDAHGSFSTKGNYAAATVRGTEWLTEDLCEGTLIRVTRDRVAVTNLVNHRHITITAGHRYLAKVP